MHSEHTHLQTAAASEACAKRGEPLVLWDSGVDIWHAPVLSDFAIGQMLVRGTIFVARNREVELPGWREAHYQDFEPEGDRSRDPIFNRKSADDIARLGLLARTKKPGLELGVYRVVDGDEVLVAVRKSA